MFFTQTNKHIPALRFPGFQNDGEWEVKRLGDITERITRKVGDRILKPISISAGIGFVDQRNKFGRDISGDQYKNYIVLERGEFAYNKGNSTKYPQGCVYQLKEFDIVACPNVFICFRIIDSNVDADFLSSYFENNYHGIQLQQYITSGVRSNGLLNISADDFFNIQIPLPPLAEQKRIAECLSSIDNMITECNNKLEQLKCHKKGLMQQLFASINGGGNSLVPKLRFPEFNNTKEWEVKKLGDICTFLDNKRIPLKDSERAKIHGRYPYYGASGIIDYVNNYIFDGEYILLSEDGANIILRNSPLAFIIKGKCWVNNHAHVLETKVGNNIYYVCHLLESINYDSLNTGTAQPKLNRENCEKIELPIPSFEEQCKIAESLNSIDNMVISYSDKMTMLSRHKKGLMQQMFPNNQMN